MRIAFLGLGIMGRPMAQNLVKAGHQVKVWNRTAGKTVEGAAVAATPKEAARDAEIVWLCVSDTKAVEQVLFGHDGAADSIQPGTIVVDSSTILPSASLKCAERIRSKGGDFVDAPVTGSKVGAEAGQLIFIVGARQATFDKLQPLFATMGKSAVRVGENGKGLAAKLSMNLMIALTFEGFAEALVLAKKQGVDLQPLMSLINQSMVRSGVVDYKAPFVMGRDFTANFPMRLMHKDIHLMLDAARQNGVKLPGLETVDRVYEASVHQGNENLDYAATLLTLEKSAGL
ncbi:MAG: NAD(P)-dependent oxidoreductase [Acidobacteria bacterium]|nr:NAD(P)-dependent oxidoreductase [Acidobacteriota bacterium]MBV9145958.1 NAD(P)-dependent oxidoreductase [Acidobacteriota bacterium]MBV9437584.1 NAD(P)-dependent oxidoreductase [Acidobacteriota bacterium]